MRESARKGSQDEEALCCSLARWCFKVRWNWYTQFHRLDTHFNQFFPTCRFEKMRTLLAGYTFSGFALLYFPPVTSCPLRGLFLIGWETKQLSCFPLKFALFLLFHFLPTEVATCSPRLLIFKSGKWYDFNSQKKGWGGKASKNGNAQQNCSSLGVKRFHCSCIQLVKHSQ